jgi:hypothetical protein
VSQVEVEEVSNFESRFFESNQEPGRTHKQGCSVTSDGYGPLSVLRWLCNLGLFGIDP